MFAFGVIVLTAHGADRNGAARKSSKLPSQTPSISGTTISHQDKRCQPSAPVPRPATTDSCGIALLMMPRATL